VGVARDLQISPWQAKYGLAVAARTCHTSGRSPHVSHDAPIPGIIIPGARGIELHSRSSCQRVAEGTVQLLLSEIQVDRRQMRCGETGNPKG
jgi:dihydroxyacetone kinase